MDIMICSDTTTREAHGATYRTLVLDAGGTVVQIMTRTGGRMDREINVLVKNASHKAWRGMGRFFPSFEEALRGYKSAKVKAAIELARDAS